MGTITLANPASSTTVASALFVSNYNILTTLFNANLDNANIATNAAIDGSKIASAEVLWQRQTLGADAATILFSSIPQGYKLIHIVYNGKNTYGAAPSQEMCMRFNGDAVSNHYFTEAMRNNNGTGAAILRSVGGGFDTSVMYVGQILSDGDGGGASDMSICEIWIPNFNDTNHRKSAISISQGNSGTEVRSEFCGHQWISNAAVTSVELRWLSASSHKTGTTASLYLL